MISDEILRNAATEAGEALMGSLPPDSPCVYPCPARLSRRANYPALYRVRNRAAGILLALVLTSAVWLSVDVRAREALFGWIRETYEAYFIYRYAGKTPAEAESSHYQPTALPPDWEEVDRWTDESGGTVLYNDGTNGLYHFTYTWAERGTPVVIETYAPKVTYVHQMPADYYEKYEESENALLVWQDKKTGVFFALSAALSQEEMIEIAESVIATEE